MRKRPLKGYLLLLLLLLKEVRNERLGESGIHNISPQTPAHKYHFIERKNRKGQQ